MTFWKPPLVSDYAVGRGRTESRRREVDDPHAPPGAITPRHSSRSRSINATIVDRTYHHLAIRTCTRRSKPAAAASCSWRRDREDARGDDARRHAARGEVAQRVLFLADRDTLVSRRCDGFKEFLPRRSGRPHPQRTRRPDEAPLRRDQLQADLKENSSYAAFVSSLTNSNRRLPPYHADSSATGRNARQRFACLSRSRRWSA